MTDLEAECRHLEGKMDKTPRETARYLMLRMQADDTGDNASLHLCHSREGAFRRVVAGMSGGLTGNEVRMLCQAVLSQPSN